MLRARGCTCWVHDLYAEGFNPVQPTPESGNVASDDPLVELHCARLQAAELIVRSALARHESRGLHYTLDYPETLAEAKDTVLVP